MLQSVLFVISLATVSYAFQRSRIHTTCHRICLQSTPNTDSNPNDSRRANLVEFGGKDYYEGMFKESVNSESAMKVDNLTPNLKFVGILGGAIFGLIGAFVIVNKDVPPPPF